MRIVLDCRMCGKSGIGAFIDGILPYFIKSENELLLLGLSKENLPATIKNICINENKVIFLPCTVKTFSLTELLYFPKCISKEINKYDFFFSPYCNIPSGIKIPIFTTIHDIVFLDVPGLSSKLGTFIRKCFYQYAIIKSKEIFTVSEFSKERIQKRLNCKKNINVVHSALPEYLNISPENIIKNNSIIFIGNIKRHKGFSTLLPAFTIFNESLKKQYKKTAKLIIVGSQDNFRTKEKTIENLLADCNKEDIEFTGYISDEELQTKLSNAKMLVQPSTYEGFGLPPMQALFSGTKALISDIPVFKEIYKDYPVTYFETNNINDLAKKMEELWQDESPIPVLPRVYGFDKTTEKILNRFRSFTNS